MDTQVEFDCLCQLHLLDKTEKDKDISWECTMLNDYCSKKGEDNSTHHECLVEWNANNKSKAWIFFLH
jgi:hypothetical protein